MRECLEEEGEEDQGEECLERLGDKGQWRVVNIWKSHISRNG